MSEDDTLWEECGLCWGSGELPITDGTKPLECPNCKDGLVKHECGATTDDT
jgi:hypothetical protein